MPFLDGVPCSIHGFVLPDGTAALRPVEIAMLRSDAERRFVYGGLGSTWDPPAADREEMRDAVRRVGAHLQAAHGYRGAFGIDGVLTAEGFRPTELNTRMSAGLTLVTGVDQRFFTLLQHHLLAGLDTGLRAADVEALVPLMDAAPQPAGWSRSPRAPGSAASSPTPWRWDGRAFHRARARDRQHLRGRRHRQRRVRQGRARARRSSPGAGSPRSTPPCSPTSTATYGSGFGTLAVAPDLR